MRTSPYQRHAPSPWQRLPFLVLILAVGGGSAFALLLASGAIVLPFMRKPPAARTRPVPEGTPVLVSARAIPAYTRIVRDHVISAKTGEFTIAYLPHEAAAREQFLTFDKIWGRVLKAEKGAGYAFRDEDFYPEGTRPGVVAGVPAGKRGFVVEADKIQGAHALQLGDRIDLLASLPVDEEKALSKHRNGPGGSPRMAETNLAELPKRASVKALAQGARVVLPVTVRSVPVGDAVLGRDGKPKLRLVHEITLAVAPEEVGPLTEALAVNARVTSVAHTGLPGEQPQPTPGLPSPMPRFVSVEVLAGGKRDVLFFPVSPEKSASRAPVRPPVEAPKQGTYAPKQGTYVPRSPGT